MVADTRKMYEIKLKLQEILTKEKYFSEMLGGFIEGGMLTKEKYEEFAHEFDCLGKLEELSVLKKEEIMENPYLKDIVLPEVELENIKLSNKRKIFANRVATYKEKYMDLDTFTSVNSYFICEKTLRFPAIVEGKTNIPWMTVEPQEIESFSSFIEQASGNVLLGGCGLGYVAYMLSLKEEIESITIVELNKDIVELFKKHILPQFKNGSKITIIEGDAIEYIQENDLSRYDYINMDIWRDVYDMLYLYLPCLEVEKKNPDIKFSYWLEPELKFMLQKSILKCIADMEDDQALYGAIAKSIVENTDIRNIHDVRECIRMDDIREILYMWYINHKFEFEELKKKSEEFVNQMMKTSEQVLKFIKENK